MRNLKVAATALNQTPLDWKHNKHNILAAIHEAKEEGVDILCLPEMCITGYGCEDHFHSIDVLDRALRSLCEIEGETLDITVVVGLPIFYRGAVFNTACLISNGIVKGFTAKRFLAGDGIHYENRWFKPWKKGIITDFWFKEYRLAQIGDLHYNINDIRVGLEICEDAWVPDRPANDLSAAGIDIILNPSASHSA